MPGGPGRAAPELDGYVASTPGPTVLTMPDLIADALGCVGERLEDWLDLHAARPRLPRPTSRTGRTLDVYADVDAMAAEIERVCGRGRGGRLPAAGRLRSRALYRLEMGTSSTATSTPRSDLLGPDLARLRARSAGSAGSAPAVAGT